MAAATPSFVLRWSMITLPLKKHPVARNVSTGAVNLHKNCIDNGIMDARLGNASQCKSCLKILTKDEIIKGFPEGEGYVLVTDDELKALAAESSKAMDLVGFCDWTDVDPKWLGNADFLGPLDKTVIRPYMLLYLTMREQELAALVTYNGHGRDKVGIIRASDESLILHDAYFPNEVRTYEDQFKVVLPTTEFSIEERKLAAQLIGTSKIDFPMLIKDQKDRYMERVESLKDARRNGAALPNFERAVATGPSMDLLAALKASLGSASESQTPSKPPVKVETKVETKTAAKKKRA